MQLALGFIAGMATATFIVAVVSYFRKPIMTKVERALNSPMMVSHGRGAVFFPKDDVTVAREEIIRRNAEQGRDTPISELQ